MTDSERSSTGQRPYPASGHKPYVEERTLRKHQIQVERKTFTFALKENPRGRFVRITEDVSGQRDTIIVPASGLAEFRRVLDELATAAEESAPATGPAAPPATPEGAAT